MPAKIAPISPVNLRRISSNKNQLPTLYLRPAEWLHTRRSPMNSKTVRIMIVDDDQDLAESLADLLKVFGYEVAIATNGKDALQRAQMTDFDITFMDVRMPVMNGVDSCLAIKQIKPDARIVMMTGFKEPILAKATAAGAEGPLQKPFSPEDMLHVVETVR
jgi:two-component system, NtrC family, response regulator HydG